MSSMTSPTLRWWKRALASPSLLRSCTAAVKIYPIEPEEDRVVGLAVQRPTAMAPAVEQMFHHIVDFCHQMDAKPLQES